MKISLYKVRKEVWVKKTQVQQVVFGNVVLPPRDVRRKKTPKHSSDSLTFSNKEGRELSCQCKGVLKEEFGT